MYFSFQLLHQLTADERKLVENASLTSRERELMDFMLTQHSKHFPAVKALHALKISRTNLYKLNSNLLTNLLEIIAPGNILVKLEYLMNRSSVYALRSQLLKQHHEKIKHSATQADHTFYREFYKWICSDNSSDTIKELQSEITAMVIATSKPEAEKEVKLFIDLNAFRVEMFKKWRNGTIENNSKFKELKERGYSIINSARQYGDKIIIRSTYDSCIFMFISNKEFEDAKSLLEEFNILIKSEPETYSDISNWYVGSMKGVIEYTQLNMDLAYSYFSKHLYLTLDHPIHSQNNIYARYFITTLLLNKSEIAREIYNKWNMQFSFDPRISLYTNHLQIKTMFEIFNEKYDSAIATLNILELNGWYNYGFSLQYFLREYRLSIAYHTDNFGTAHALSEKNLTYIRYSKRNKIQPEVAFHSKFVKVLIKCIRKKRQLQKSEFGMLVKLIEYHPLHALTLQRCFNKYQVLFNNEPLVVWEPEKGISDLVLEYIKMPEPA